MVTKEEFHSYQTVQYGGLYNMFDPRAGQRAGLTPEQVVYVMKNYKELQLKYGDKDGLR